MKWLILLALTGCADFLPTDPNPEYNACIKAAQNAFDHCYEIDYNHPEFNLAVTCISYFNSDVRACRP